MKTVYLFITSLLLVYAQASAQTWQWTHPEKNGNPPDHAVAHDVETDASGNVYVLGDFDDSLFLSGNFIAKGGGSYLAKYDSTGKLLWNKLFVRTDNTESGDQYSIRATDLTVNSTGVYITGKYAPSSYDCSTGSTISLQTYKIGNLNLNSSGTEVGFFLTKFNGNGKVVWNKTATDPSICVNGAWKGWVPFNPVITSDNANNVVCGFVYGSNNPSLLISGNSIPLRPGGSQASNAFYFVVAKYNGSGTLQWSNYAGGGFAAGQADGNGYIWDGSNSIIADKNNNIFVTGSAKDSTYFGAQLFHTSAPPNNGGYSYALSTFIAKISSAGVWQFAKELLNSATDYLINPDLLCADDQNNIYALANNFWNRPQPIIILGDTVAHAPLADNELGQYLVKIKNNGSLVWHKGFDGGTVVYTHASSISFANNSLYITGSVFEPPTPVFGNLTVPRDPSHLNVNEYFVAKANTNGDFQWVATAGSTGTSSIPYSNGMEGLGVRAFKDNVYTAGYYIGGINTLGNLNGTYTGDGIIHNIFFGKLKDQSIRVGAITPKQIIPGCTITIPFTSDGLSFSNKNKLTAELSDASGDFTTPTAIGSIKSTGTGTITATIPASLTYGSGYRVRIHSSDTLKTAYNYYAYADTGYVLSLICPSPSAGFTATNITAASATLNWIAVGCASGYKVQYRKKGTTAWTTAPVITTNTPTINLTGLTANTIYQWRVATRCKNNGTFSFSAFSAIKTFTTAAVFAVNGIDGSSIGSANSLQLIIQPNPATTVAALIISGVIKNAHITITDFAGKTVWEKDDVNSNRIDLPVEKFASGVYIVKLTNGNKTSTLKLVKE